MLIRVHELAKELKISAAALKKHLSDLGVSVKSHMSFIEDDVDKKIRNMFNAQVSAARQADTDRKKFHEVRKPTVNAEENQTAPVVEEQKERQHESVHSVSMPTSPKDTNSEPVEAPSKPTTERTAPKKIDMTERKPSDQLSGGRDNSTRPAQTNTNHNDSPRQNTYQPRDNQGGYQQRDGQRQGGYQPREGQGGYQQRDGQRQGGYQPRDNQGGYQQRDGQRQGGYQPREGQGGYQQRDGQRQGGYQPREGQGGYQQRDGQRQGGYQPRDNQGGYQQRDGQRQGGYQPREGQGGYQQRDGQRQGGYQPREGQGGYQQRDGQRQGGYQPREGQGGYQQRDGQRQGGYQPRDNQGGYQQRDGQRQGGYQPREGQGGYQQRDGQRQGGYQQRNSYPPKDGQGSSNYIRKPKPDFPVRVETVVKDAVKRQHGKTKVTAEDLGDKSNHLKAKMKLTKAQSKPAIIETVDVEEADLVKTIKQTLAKPSKKKKYHKEQQSQPTPDTEVIIREFTSVSELAKILGVTPAEVISKFFTMGKMVTINQRLDRDSLELICSEYEIEVTFEDEYGTDMIEEAMDKHSDVEELPRPPVVTIMGHVDHGKTSILDYIRHEKVVAGEAGGITQHIGAYQIQYNNHKITFLDTPGHEAFTAMRSRGANITDIAVIVVAANDGVMPQTVEAIDHARAAGVLMIIAINKVDLPEANVDRTIAMLLEKGVYLEQYGGDVLWLECSAKTGQGINNLLELILLASEMKELKARQAVPGQGVVLEAQKDTRMGTKLTILLQEGTLNKGDSVVCGATYGRIRRIENERGKEIKRMIPSDVAVIYGLTEVPKAGDVLSVVESDKIARQISSERTMMRLEREKFQSKTNLQNLFTRIKEHEMSYVNLIIKADTDGSVEALCDSFQKLSNEEVAVNIIHKGVGGIIEADVSLAGASDAIIIGFHVRANTLAKKLAEDESVEIKLYQIIYDAINDVKLAMQGMLAPTFEEKFQGNAIVKQVFKIKKIGTIAGCAVEKGSLRKDSLIRLYRNDIAIYEGKTSSLKHYSNDVSEVKAGMECGISLEDFLDIKEGDVIEAYAMEEVQRKI